MHVISIQVGLPRWVQWNGKDVRTSIYKSPVTGRIASSGNNLAGDMQSDPSVHGGEHKAVYAYPSEHYGFWEEMLAADLPFGAFGENLTTEGLIEDQVKVGDRFRIGTLELIAAQPRLPCYKLGIRHGRDDMVKLFLEAEKPGIYFQIGKPGELEAGDSIERLEKGDGPTIVELMRSKLAR